MPASIISRDGAIALNLKNYFTGIPCKHGHISERLVSSQVCSVCNTALGHFKEDIGIMQSAIEYLKAHSEDQGDISCPHQ